MSVLGDFVKLRREELGLEQTDLARELGVNQQTVSKWESAKAVPRPQRMGPLAKVLRVETEDLMRYAGYLPDGDAADQSNQPLHQLLAELTHLTNDQLIILIDQAWEEYRGRAGFTLDGANRPRNTGGGT